MSKLKFIGYDARGNPTFERTCESGKRVIVKRLPDGSYITSNNLNN